MANEKELQDAFRKLGKREVDTFATKVLSVDKAKGTCKVTDDEITYTDVRLTSIIGGNGKAFYLFPKVGSSVLVSPINEDLRQLYVEQYSEVESLDLIIEGVKLQIDQDGFLLKKQNETLKALMGDLIKAIKQMSFIVTTTGTAAAQTGQTTTLNNLAAFTAVENRFNQFLKDN